MIIFFAQLQRRRLLRESYSLRNRRPLKQTCTYLPMYFQKDNIISSSSVNPMPFLAFSFDSSLLFDIYISSIALPISCLIYLFSNVIHSVA